LLFRRHISGIDGANHDRSHIVTFKFLACDANALAGLDSELVRERSVVVRGFAPPGAIITRDIPFWFDEHTRADSAGRWSFAVELLPGDNKLTFRIGDETATAQSITVRYDAN
jgi:hypothetical protein